MMEESSGPGRSSGGESEAADSHEKSEACPFCDGRDTELMSLFGSHASLTTYWCRRCRSPFEILRWRAQASTRSTSV